MRVVLWTKQAQADLAAIRAFISQDSPHYASVPMYLELEADHRRCAGGFVNYSPEFDAF